MKTDTLTQPNMLYTAAVTAVLCLFLTSCATTGQIGADDPMNGDATAETRVGLEAGWHDAEQAAWNMELIAHEPRPEGYLDPDDPGTFAFANTDLAFQNDLVFLGNYNGVQVWNISDPDNPSLRATFECPGGQGDLSVYGVLLFMSVEQTRGRLDCGGQGVETPVSDERFRGVRIFDISDLDDFEQIAAVQTCRGSHTHTLVPSLNDPDNVYIYVQGTSYVRPAAELAGCSDLPPSQDPNTSYFRIQVIQVPLAAPETAEIVSSPRIFERDGNIAGLWPGGAHGPNTQETSMTNQCHDITVYPALDLAAGACSGNGLLLDISDPVNPERIDYVSSPYFAYWHSATFNNEGTSVLYTDEWGGGSGPYCRSTDPMTWGANAIFTLEDGDLSEDPASYYKLPAAQTEFENCVAHNGSLVPVPGRDIMVQSWYQGGSSVFDFTDPSDPVEIAYFDRGPIYPDELVLGGYWSSYWYDGVIVGSEIARGLDIFRLEPSQHLSANEIAAARLVDYDGRFNPQTQPHVDWPASFVVARAYMDQLARNSAESGISQAEISPAIVALDQAEQMEGNLQAVALTELAAGIDDYEQAAVDPSRVRDLATVLRELAR